ncbi:serine hydrolase [Mangrovactinospora gilvigrisea]|uniref:Serine hydrolase n=1 Tax=Mangrovactinospora gilvigrisea TaxID=1428644 RepID=A0A1J7CAH5_9ACTN|nr:serine hydrolase domain-containing protein [Mangrovactinospora gilvigrisea]OIV38516.1 serine hydrolase [Mangrovactinospora gilvigrisea]
MKALQQLGGWPVGSAAAAVVTADGVVATQGPQDRRFPLASVTKLLTAYAVHTAVEEGALEYGTPAGPPGSTVRHLLAHTSGLAFNEDRATAAPGTRRLYSNTGFEVLAEAVQKATDIAFPEYLAQAVLEPLGMGDSALAGPAGSGGVSTAADLSRFAAELLRPRLLDPATVEDATLRVAFPGLSGVLPGLGHQRPNDWGLGFEIRDHKSPHWTGAHSSPRTFGHFGQSGTFLWVDPDAAGGPAALVVLTDRDFDAWARELWPPLTDAVLAELGQAG